MNDKNLSLVVMLSLFFLVLGCEAEPAQPAGPTGPMWTAYQKAEIAPPLTVIEDYDDIPSQALGPQIGPDGYVVEEIVDGFYWVTEGTYQMMFVVTQEGVIVVDAPPTIGDKALKAIAQVTTTPITHVIYSHSHIDHIGAAAQYPDDAVIIAHEETARQLTRAKDPNRPVPTQTFDERFTLSVGGKTLELEYPGNNHDPGNIIIHAPAAKLVMVVDVVFPGWMMWRRLALAEDIPGLFHVMHRLLKLDFDVIVTGHVGRLGKREDVEAQLSFMNDLTAAAGEGLMSVSLDTVGAALRPEDRSNPWAFFDGYIDRVVHHCVDKMAPKWRDKLAAFDVFIYDQCLAMEQSLRIDGMPPQE